MDQLQDRSVSVLRLSWTTAGEIVSGVLAPQLKRQAQTPRKPTAKPQEQVQPRGVATVIAADVMKFKTEDEKPWFSLEADGTVELPGHASLGFDECKGVSRPELKLRRTLLINEFMGLSGAAVPYGLDIVCTWLRTRRATHPTDPQMLTV